MESRKPKKPILNSPLKNSQSVFKDISNCKTPKPPSKTPLNFQCSPQYFTASKCTPISSSRRTVLKSNVARKLKAFELEQVKSARKAHTEKEKSLKSLTRSLTVWLNFLLENPSSCGCIPANCTGDTGGFDFSSGSKDVFVNNGKRESESAHGVGVDGPWRGPKRQRNLSWSDDGGKNNRFLDSKFFGLRASLKDICSFEDLKERMRMYLSLGSCADIFEAMTSVTKNIDEGRIKMKPSCPIVSDVGIKEKSLKILMCYNPTWLRIGLYVILGGEFLLPNGDVNSEQENAFLRKVIENQFFCHSGLAKAYAYNKLVDGLYRPGYYEKLGNVILKRLLLLVIILDKAKSDTSLPLKYGIDGLDGGSPLLFSSKFSVKSSRQLIIDFLSSDVMHGEGNLLTHLAIVGYKISYQQNPLVEYDFKVTDLFRDLQDGVLLCRAIQLLKHDSSILMKAIVPSDTHKKRLVNCDTALQYLRQAGVPLVDEDGIEVSGEDVVNGDKELTLALLWNIFVHLQLPLLINKRLLAEEISNIRGLVADNLSTQTLLELLLGWIQAVCETYEFKIESHSSLMDGKAMWCLLDFYFRKEHDCLCSFKEDSDGRKEEVSIMSAIEYTDAVHNFLLSQKLTSLLGNFPEVLQVSDILEHNGACNGKTVLVLLVFLSVQLLVKRNMDKLNFHKLLGFTCQSPVSRRLSTKLNNEQDTTRDFKAIMTWWQDMAQKNGNCSLKPAAFSMECFLTGRKSTNIQRENAATMIQSHFRRFLLRQNFMRIKEAALVIQGAALACLLLKKKQKKVPVKELKARSEQGQFSSRSKQLEKFQANVGFMVDRNHFMDLKKSIIVIQKATKAWIGKRNGNGVTLGNQVCNPDLVNASTVIQSCIRGWTVKSVFNQRVTSKEKALVMPEEDTVNDLQTAAATKIQQSWKKKILCKSIENSAATLIQCLYRGWLMRKNFACYKQAIRTIQRSFRHWKIRRDLIRRVENASAVIIQSHVRGWMTRKKSFGEKQTLTLMQHSAAIKIQSYYRGWLMRKNFACYKQAIRTIQRSFRHLKIRRDLIRRVENASAVVIQSYVRGWIIRKKSFGEKQTLTLMQHSAATKIQSYYRGWLTRKFFAHHIQAIRKSRRDLIHREEISSAIVIQSHVRGWMARERASKEKHILTSMQEDSARTIQSAFRCMTLRNTFLSQRHAAVDIQRFARGEITRKRLLGASNYHKILKHSFRGLELKIFLRSVVKLQRWWSGILQEKMKTKAAIVIQSYFRGLIARKMAKREKMRLVVIQAYWKGYLARKHARDQVLDLRLRMQKTAANVDDNMRLINRLLAALSELLNMKSLSSILRTCSTLDVATEHSQKCCEALVAAGAIGTLLKLIQSTSRSIPEQQVLKHALSTLRNLSRYSHLIEPLMESRGCIEIIFLEFLRNKEEGYFIASELLKKICISQKGVKVMSKSPAILRRLKKLIEELGRKKDNDKRNVRNMVKNEHAGRLREAMELLQLIQ